MVLPLFAHTHSLLSLNLRGIKSAVKPNWKTNGFVQWEAASINPHLQRKAEAETGEFAAAGKAGITSQEMGGGGGWRPT